MTRRGDLHYYVATTTPPDPSVDQTVAVLGAVSGMQCGAPMIGIEGVVPPRLSAQLYHRPNLNTLIEDLPGSFGRQWQDELNETGSASMTIGNEDAQATVVREGDIVRYEDEGYACFAWIVREIERVQIAEGEEHDQVTHFSGNGLLSMLSEGVVYPARGPEVKPYADERLFSWPAADYDDQWWSHAADLGPAYEGYWTDGIIDYPANGARWIWAHVPNALEWAPDGPCYVRSPLDVPPGVNLLRIYLILDAEGDIYIDGQPVGSAIYDAEPVSPAVIDVEITPGPHNVAIKCTNDVDPESDQIHNPGGVLFSCYGVNSVGEWTPPTPILVSDSSWRIVEYPPYEPGMTPGEVMTHVVAEAQARGALLDLTLGFDTEVDSDGNPWNEYTNIGTDVGTDVLSFFREMCNTYIDMWMEPAAFRLHAWVKGMRGSHLADVELKAVTDPLDPWSGNLAGLSYRRVD